MNKVKLIGGLIGGGIGAASGYLPKTHRSHDGKEEALSKEHRIMNGAAGAAMGTAFGMHVPSLFRRGHISKTAMSSFTSELISILSR